jgi:hypothetical protein
MHIAFLVFILILHKFQNNYGHGVSSTNTKEKKKNKEKGAIVRREQGIRCGGMMFSLKKLSWSCELSHVVPLHLGFFASVVGGIMAICNFWHCCKFQQQLFQVSSLPLMSFYYGCLATPFCGALA